MFCMTSDHVHVPWGLIATEDKQGMFFQCPNPSTCKLNYKHPDPGPSRYILITFSLTKTDPEVSILSPDIPNIDWTGPVSGPSATNVWEFHSIHNALQMKEGWA